MYKEKKIKLHLIFIVVECINKVIETHTDAMVEGSVWTETDQLIVLKPNTMCPICREDIGEKEDLTPVDEALMELWKNLAAIEKRARVSDKYFRDQLKKKDMEIMDLKSEKERLNYRLREVDFKLQLKTSRLQFIDEDETRIAEEKEAENFTSDSDEDMEISNDPEIEVITLD